ncbi:MAG: radical SAM protein [Chloroflexi bacterium]|nr:MAG: radical SAM protein [Chloroflexota bacterium]
MAELESRRAEIHYDEIECKSALNPVKGMGFNWSLNPYVGCEHRCAFCYVRAYESWKKETVVIGAATDPYQPAEGRFKLTRKCLEALRDFSNPAGLITRGPMIVRDIDVLTELAKRADLGVTFSIPTIDMDVWRKTEPGTAPPQQRLRAIEKLVAAGIKASVGMAPILPGLSDRPEQIEAVVKAARAAGATGVWGGMLHLRPGTREHFMTVLQRHWPELVPEYERMYRDRPYLPAALAEPSMREVARLREIHQVRDRRPIRLQPPPPPKQLSLLT